MPKVIKKTVKAPWKRKVKVKRKGKVVKVKVTVKKKS